MKRLFHHIQPFFTLSADMFPYALICYLMLFLLENLFPGFVSNNFSITWILGFVLALGFLAACAPEKSKISIQKPNGKSEYLMVIILSVIGGAIVFAKVDAAMVMRWVTAFTSAGFIGVLGYVSLSGEDETPQQTEKRWLEDAYDTSERFNIRQAVIYIRQLLRPIFVRRIELPILYVLIFVVCTIFLIPENIKTLANTLRRPNTVSIMVTPTQIPVTTPFYWNDANESMNILPSENLRIIVLNGGAKRGSSASFSAILRESGFNQVIVGNADRYDYINAEIRFRESDKPQATLIKRLLEDQYPIIMELPAEASASGITVILGRNE